MKTASPPLGQSALGQPPPRQPFAAASLLRVTLLALLLFAFALRAWRLDFQSLWSDEGISLVRASLPLGEMLAAMPVEHAPAYFVLVHGWLALTGTTDYALRYLSLIPSVLVVALLFRQSLEFAWPERAAPWLSLLAAALAATSAFQIWYAQEARMYAWLMASALASTWALWRVLHPRGRVAGWAILYTLGAAACVYLHFYGAFVAVAQAIYVMGWVLATRRWRPFLAWLASAAAALLLFLPWLPRALGVTAFAGWRAPGDVMTIPWAFLRAYLLAPNTPPALEWRLWPVLALAALGLAWWLWRRPGAGWLLALLIGAPITAVFVLALRNPDFHERYTAWVAPFVLSMVAAGTVGLSPAAWRRAGAPTRGRRLHALVPALVGLLLTAGSLALTLEQATNASMHKPDYRAAAARIQREQQPGDVILVDGPNPELVFEHYYTGGLPVVDLRDLEGKDGDAVDARLRDIAAGAGRAWEVLFFHPPAAVQVWLATRAWATDPTDHNGIRVTLYGLPAGTDAAQSQELDFGPALRLVSSAVAPGAIQAGDLVRVTTEWFTLATPPDYKFSLRVVDAAGQIVHSQDYVPQNWFAPTSVWVVGAAARDQRGIATAANLAPADYAVKLRVYDAATGAPVVTAAGEDIPLGGFKVLSP